MFYRGYEYQPYIDEEPGEVRKIFHEIVRPDGSEVPYNIVPSWFRNISPYREATLYEFHRAVDTLVFLDFFEVDKSGKTVYTNNINI